CSEKLKPRKTVIGLLLLVFLFLRFFSSFGQNIVLNGRIMDSLKNPLENTNIIATPLSNDDEMIFSIADNRGEYRLKLKKDISYEIEINQLGFTEVRDTLNLKSNKIKDYTMLESHHELEEIRIESEMAVVIKE